MNRKRKLYQHIFHFLPEQFNSLCKDGPVNIDFPTNTELADAYQLINDVVDKELGFGSDEYPNLGYFMDAMTHDSVLPFIVTELLSNKVVGFFYIAPTRFHRGVNPLYCDVSIVLQSSYRTLKFLNDLLNSVVWRYVQILGYEGFIGDYLSNDDEGLRSLVKLQGYEILGRLPCVAQLKHSGPVDSVIIMKRFNTDAKRCSQTEVRPRIVVPVPDITGIKINDQPKMATPQTCTILDGRKIQVDYANQDELRTIYELFIKAQKEGDGYAIDEYPTFNHFIYKFRKGHVFSMKVTDGKIVGFMSVIPTRFSRSAKPTIGAGPMYITNEIRGKGNFPKILLTQFILGIQCGYIGSIGDTFVKNKPVVRVSGGKDGSDIIATIPRSAYVAGEGWVDTYVTGGKFSDKRLFNGFAAIKDIMAKL